MPKEKETFCGDSKYIINKAPNSMQFLGILAKMRKVFVKPDFTKFIDS